jgi:thiol:disulfide interchange protein DsbG
MQTNTRTFSRRFALAASAAACLMAAGCSDAESVGAGSAQGWRKGGIKDAQKALDALSSGVQGFSVGESKAPRVAYVMFDPKCPHCAVLWAAAKPVSQQGQVRFVWIPVAFISKDSVLIGASILDQANPINTMDANEASIAIKAGGVKVVDTPSDKAFASIVENSKVAISLGLEEVPLIVMKAADGKAVVSAGSMNTQRLKDFLSL